MSYRGDFRAGDVIDLKFTTLNLSAVPTTLAGTPAISVYKSNSVTESTAGVTLSVDFDSRTGMNHVRITTVTDGTFYAEGSDFDVVITAGTVNSVSVVGLVVASFSLANRSALRPSTKALNLNVSSGGAADANEVSLLGTAISTPGTAGILDVNLINVNNVAAGTTAAQLGVKVISQANIDFGALQKTSLNAATPASVVGAVGSVTGAVGSVTAAVSVSGDFSATMKSSLNAATPASVTGAVGSVTGAVGSVTAAVAVTGDFTSTMKSSLVTAGGTAQTGDCFALIGTAGVGLTNLGDTRIAELDAAVSSRLAPGGTLATVTTAVNVTNAPTAGDLTAAMKASVTAAAPTAAAIAAATGARAPSAEVYAADGAIPTYDQFLFMIWAALAQFAVAGETITAKKLDGTTSAMVFTTDDPINPTTRVRTA
jgi:hypothetical protein